MPRFQTYDGTEIFYTAWGTDEPVLFLHGGNIGSEIWEFQLPYFVERGNRCITYDQRGFGRSDWPSAGYDFDTLASDLNQFIDHLNLQNFAVVAFSFGGCVLARYLSHFGGNRVTRAALVSTLAPFIGKTANNPDGVDSKLLYEPFRTAMKRDRSKAFRDAVEPFFNSQAAETPVSESVKEWAIRACMKSPLVPMLDIGKSANETDFREDMSAFRMPTLMIHGDADVFAPPQATVIRVQRLIPGGELKMYPGASHGLLFTHQDRLNKDLATFLTCSEPDFAVGVDQALSEREAPLTPRLSRILQGPQVQT